MKTAEKDDRRRAGNTLPKFRVSVNAERSTSTTVKTFQNSETKTIFHLFPTSSKMANQPAREQLNYPEQGNKDP